MPATCRAAARKSPPLEDSRTAAVAVRPAQRDAVLAALAEDDIAAAEVGEVMPGKGVLWLTLPDGSIVKLTQPEPDPYWPAYAACVG